MRWHRRPIIRAWMVYAGGHDLFYYVQSIGNGDGGDEMTENKFTVGSQWTTKGGWRAVVVTNIKTGYLVWHENENETFLHHTNGAHTVDTDYDLINLHTELRKGTVWVNIWVGDDGEPFALVFDKEADYIEDKVNDSFYTCIASFKHDWTENEKL